MYTYFVVFNHAPFSVFLFAERSTRKRVDNKLQRFFTTFAKAKTYALTCAKKNIEDLEKSLKEMRKAEIKLESIEEDGTLKRLTDADDVHQKMMSVSLENLL